jgi:hypothetical protein
VHSIIGPFFGSVVICHVLFANHMAHAPIIQTKLKRNFICSLHDSTVFDHCFDFRFTSLLQEKYLFLVTSLIAPSKMNRTFSEAISKMLR